jgi:hypothetical protein
MKKKTHSGEWVQKKLKDNDLACFFTDLLDHLKTETTAAIAATAPNVV